MWISQIPMDPYIEIIQELEIDLILAVIFGDNLLIYYIDWKDIYSLYVQI